MDEAYQALRASSRRVKHLILLSDGQSPPRDYSGLAARMARDGITVSTVAVGADADTHTMRVIAEAGKGRTYAASDPALLPRIFTKEALTIQRSYVVEESFRPRLVSGHEVLSGLDLASAPALHGYVATWPRGEAELLLASHRDDPVLALWRTGLGKAVAFTPDLGARWSRDWAAWPGWGRLWSQLFRWSATGAAPGGIHVRSAWAAGKLHVSADLVGEEGDYVNFARLETAASAPGGRRRTAALRQTGPGRYEGTIDAPEPGAHLVTVTERARPPGRSDASASDLAASDIAASGLATVDVPYSPEFRPSGDGRANLERVAAAVGARIATDPAAVFRHDLPIPGQRRPLRPLLLWILPFVLLADVAVRRVALPEGWLSRLAGRVAARLPRLRPAAPAEAPAPLRRLRSIKEALGRGESSEALPASPSVPPPDATLAAAPPPPTPGTDEAVAPEPSAAAGSTTGRLLAAKRRLK
jgi:uncharacterized membrane protein